MISFKDRSFCSNPDCDDRCGRKFYGTKHEKEYKQYVKEFGFEIGISFADFCKMIDENLKRKEVK